ncbi:MAG TPA: tRNA-uridine aminocarboxypropyltransferase [Planctomycetota bacterium]|nr:tRNA-uridine aminocarboxypropyltransferase [Planctomycetota bacterium]
MSHERVKRKPRCPGCGLPPATCACARLPKRRFSTPIAIVQHVRESYKPTNTGRLFARMTESTLLLPAGMREPAFDPGPLRDPSIEWTLIYPREGAPVLDPAPTERRRGFVLLDGSWRQCAHLSRRLPVIRDLPCAALPPGPPSFWSVRAQHDQRGRSTFEAALQLVELYEGRAATQPLREAFAMVTAHMLFLKGKLRSPEIPGSWGLLGPSSATC